MNIYKISTLILTMGVLVACNGETASPKIDDIDVLAKSVETKTENEAASLNVQEVAETTDPVLIRGQRMFLRCKSCHTVEKDGRNGTGPNIYAVFGAAAAQKDGFKYSKAMEDSGIVWTDDAMDLWIEKPGNLVPGTSMAFVGIKKPEDRAALIAYLKEVTK